MELQLARQIFRKILKCQISWKSVHWNASCSMLADGWTCMTKLTRTRLINHKPLSLRYCTAPRSSPSWAPQWWLFAGGCGRSTRAERVCYSVVGRQSVLLLLYKSLPCLRSSWVLRGGGWYLFTDVLRQPRDSSFTDPAAKVGSFLPPWRMKQ